MAILKPDKTTVLDTGLTVNEYFLTAHNPNKIALPSKRTASQQLIGVTLHNTGWIAVASGTTPAEQYVRATVNGNMGDTRVHYYVDDKCAWRDLPDDYTSWHAATGGQGQGNCNTISIECIMENQTDPASLVSMENTAKLIANIFKTYGWTVAKNLYTHNYWTNYRATGKLSADLDEQSLKKVSTSAKCFNDSNTFANSSGKYCPIFILPQWEKFKALVNKYLETSVPQPLTPSTPTVTPPETMYRVRKTWSDKVSQKGAYKVLDNAKKCADENAGYSVFDDNGAIVYTGKEPASPYEIYTVVKGDSLWGISAVKLGNGARYGEIKTLNNMPTNVIYSGQKLKIPKKITH
jgi:N-acetylmuramoyl-L-alanine amidase CwlA